MDRPCPVIQAVRDAVERGDLTCRRKNSAPNPRAPASPDLMVYGRWRPEPGAPPAARRRGAGDPLPAIPTFGTVARDRSRPIFEPTDASTRDARGDGTPTTTSAWCDDWGHGASPTIRGDDHVNNTPRQINIHRALAVTPPVVATCRHGAGRGTASAWCATARSASVEYEAGAACRRDGELPRAHPGGRTATPRSSRADAASSVVRPRGHQPGAVALQHRQVELANQDT